MMNFFYIIFLLFLINLYICETYGALSENIESAEEIDTLKTSLRNGHLNNTYFNEENNNLNIGNEINNTNYKEVTEESKEELYDINENIFPDYFFLDIVTENQEQKNEEVPVKTEVVSDEEELETESVIEEVEVETESINDEGETESVIEEIEIETESINDEGETETVIEEIEIETESINDEGETETVIEEIEIETESINSSDLKESH
ncbi:putative protein, unknown function [Plasmodium gaboni]|uniref:Uncharacterized protein n=1 Tax=Plasmodium gaboni TaxID=647221 RepID=A0A151L3E3_9APIC|nr:putative protein, unknown function [Plasmodium gaboni]KYN93470.1 putative protein, unknown function [Plasmodium gaboni]